MLYSRVSFASLGYMLLYLFMTVSLEANISVQLLEPAEESVVEKDSVAAVVKIYDRTIDKVRFYGGDGGMSVQKVTPSRDVYCQTLMLKPGVNSLIIRAYAGDRKVFEKIVDIYYKLQLYKQYNHPPSRFVKRYFHTDENEQSCKRCHRMRSNERPDMAFENPEDSNCYQCHKNIVKYRYAHAPAVNWLCGACHGREKSSLSKYIPPKKVNASCFRCHQKFRQAFDHKKYKHEPVVAGRCNRCHNPHSSDQLFFVRLPVNRLCVTCHESKAAREPQGNCAASGQGSCTGCHDPHASQAAYFYEPGRHRKKQAKPKGFWIDE